MSAVPGYPKRHIAGVHGNEGCSGAAAGQLMTGISPEPTKDRAVFPELVLAKGICKAAKKPANRCERVLFLDPTKSDALTEGGKSLNANEPGAQTTATAPTL